MTTITPVRPGRVEAALRVAARYQAPDGENGTYTGNAEWDRCLDAMAVLAHHLNYLLTIGIRPEGERHDDSVAPTS